MLLVTWRDASFDYEADGQPIDFVVRTLGFEVERSPLFVSIAQEKLPDGTWRAVTHIPVVCVLKIEQLKEITGASVEVEAAL